MSILVGKYTFTGPFKSLNKLKNKPGLYAVHCPEKKGYKLIDLGEAAMIRDRIKSHERMKCWLLHSQNRGITLSVYYTKNWPQTNRMKVVKELREIYNPPCGKKTDGKLYFLH